MINTLAGKSLHKKQGILTQSHKVAKIFIVFLSGLGVFA
jgi:hypothetical protein